MEKICCKGGQSIISIEIKPTEKNKDEERPKNHLKNRKKKINQLMMRRKNLDTKPNYKSSTKLVIIKLHKIPISDKVLQRSL